MSQDIDLPKRKKMRLKDYDYSKEGLYYITICTDNRKLLFGNVNTDIGIMILNEFGKIAQENWNETERIRDNIKLHQFIIMPNHIHVIIEITHRRGVLHTPGIEKHIPEIKTHTSPDIENIKKNTPPQSPKQTIGSIIRGYKASVTKKINLLIEKGDLPRNKIWQRSYYDHIIRDEKDYNRITNYIINNPLNWKHDDFYK